MKIKKKVKRAVRKVGHGTSKVVRNTGAGICYGIATASAVEAVVSAARTDAYTYVADKLRV